MKYKKKIKRLEVRIRDYEKTTAKLTPDQRAAYKKPGSVKK
jgi:hypothetical protein